MNKIIIASIFFIFATLANAEYMIKIPLEQAQGGHLPNNSIVFVSSTEVVPETPVKHEPVDCLTNPTDNPQLCEKSLTAWEQFASVNGLSNTWNWIDLQWGYKGLSYLPNAPYPITSVGNLYLSENQLTNVDGLSAITSAVGIYLNGNPLTNVDGLANVRVSDYIIVDSTYSGPKLAANTRFCTLNRNSVFPVWNAQKSQLCESP